MSSEDLAEEPERPTEDFVFGGDAIPGEVVKDSHGTYIRMAVNPDSPAMQLDPTVIDASAYDNGFTDEQILEGQQFAVKFLTEEAFDSKTLDGDDASFEEWVGTYARDNMLESQLETIARGTGTIIRTDETLTMPTLIRDGGPRVKAYDIRVTSVTGGATDDGSFLAVYAKISVSYRVTDEGLLQFAKDNVMVGGTEENVLSFLSEEAKDGTGENLVNFTVERELGVGPQGGSWKIGGTQTFDLYADIRESLNI